MMLQKNERYIISWSNVYLCDFCWSDKMINLILKPKLSGLVQVNWLCICIKIENRKKLLLIVNLYLLFSHYVCIK